MTAALKKGCRNPGLIGLVGLATTGLYGYVLFWSWLFWPRVGRLVALVCPIAALAVTLIMGRTLAGPARKLLRVSLVPILLIGAYATMVLSLGFIYGGLDAPFKTAERRFSHPLPNDNAIPFIFAEGVWWHVIEKPLVGDWHSSDRPPLQAGLTLAPERFLPHDREMTAQMVGVFTQSTWILALWAFLLTLEIDSDALVLVLSGCMTSGFVLTNTFYVWPKLLAGAFAVGALTLLITISRRPLAGEKKWAAALCGVLWTLAVLSHGGAAFAFIGAAITALLLRPRIPFRNAAILLSSAFLLYLPWLLYQRLFDPPGNRLLLMHIAGLDKPDPRPFGQALLDSYRALSFSQIISNKWQNWLAAIDQIGRLWDALLHFSTPDLRADQFFFLVPSLGFIALGLPLLLLGSKKQFRTRYWTVAVWLLVFLIATVVVWCVLMFGPFTTVLHQGTYAVPLLAFTACCLSLWSMSRKLAWTIVAAQAVLNVVLYLFLIKKQLPDHQFVDFGTIRLATAAIALVSAAAIVLLLYCMAAADDSGVERGQKTVHLFAFKS